jgi:hypothetical protein
MEEDMEDDRAGISRPLGWAEKWRVISELEGDE